MKNSSIILPVVLLVKAADQSENPVDLEPGIDDAIRQTDAMKDTAMASYDVDGMGFSVAYSASPMQRDVLNSAIEAARTWPEAKEVCSGLTGHLVIGPHSEQKIEPESWTCR